MDDGHDIKADLVIAMQTLDTETFKQILFNLTIEISNVIDHDSCNIFHEISISSLPEAIEIEFLEILIAYFYKRFEEKASYHIKNLINKTSSKDKLTPLMLAAKGSKLVCIYLEYD